MRFVSFILAVCIAAPALATRVGDVTRLHAQREERLTGMGLVFGLRGTGDGGRFTPAMRPLAEMLGHFNNNAALAELQNASNVAIVAITVTVPENGVRGGDKLDVHITSVGAARSLEGGRLFVTPLTGPAPGAGVFALAEGAVVLENAAIPTVGRVEGGAVMEVDLPKQFIVEGRFTLVLDDAAASWTLASTIAQVINDSEDGQEWAIALDPKNVLVTIPPAERDRPDGFISRILRLPVPVVAEEARVRINERLGTIVITGDVTLSPVVISMRGLTIRTGGGLAPAEDPAGEPRTQDFLPLHMAGTSQQQRARLQDLVDVFDQLKVPPADRVAILKELHRTGKLHARLIVE